MKIDWETPDIEVTVNEKTIIDNKESEGQSAPMKVERESVIQLTSKKGNRPTKHLCMQVW